MKTYHKSYGVTASITDMANGAAKMVAKDQRGRKIVDKVYISRKSAAAAWRRMCS